MGRAASAVLLCAGLTCALFALSDGVEMKPASELGVQDSPAPPVFPDAYKMRYTFYLPYITTVQAETFKMPIDVWYDGPAQKLRVDVYDGLDATYMTPAATWTVFPRLRDYACVVVNNTVGPTAGERDAGGLKSGAGVAPPLPDMSTWTYAGRTTVRGVDAALWKSGLRVDDKVNTYTFFITPDGRPLKLHMMGLNLLTGSHYDEYLVEFDSFAEGPLAGDSFEPPQVCDAPVSPSEAAAGVEDSPRRLVAQALSLLPSSNVVTDVSGPGGAPLGTSESRPALSQQHLVLRAHEALVRDWNTRQAEEAGFTLALNKFATWTDERFRSTMLGTKSPWAQVSATATATADATVGSTARPLLGRPGHGVRQQQQQQQRPEVFVHRPGVWLGEYRRVVEDGALPKSVDWRGSPADGPVKDQASCGSCWAFAAVGALQAAWYNATGVALSLSEQQLVDCSWEHRNGGCGGGYPSKAMEYIVEEEGGLWAEDAYPYRGANDFCKVMGGPKDHAHTPHGGGRDAREVARGAGGAGGAGGGVGRRPSPEAARFAGYKTIKAGDERAVMEALALHGPLAVSMNAAHPTFKFYSEGVYYRKDCGQTPDDMDHAVVLSGYGTDPKTGKDYWIIRNSWSTFWGSDGYAKIARKDNDCGISLEAVMALASVADPTK